MKFPKSLTTEDMITSMKEWELVGYRVEVSHDSIVVSTDDNQCAVYQMGGDRWVKQGIHIITLEDSAWYWDMEYDNDPEEEDFFPRARKKR
jgi:hypothetical protein